MRHETLLLEIGTEELPPKSLLALKTAFAENLKKALDARQFNYSDVAAFATPRRLAVIVTACEDIQPEQLIQRKGPKLSAAFDSDGQPTKALNGFLKSCGITDPNLLEQEETEKGAWVLYRSTQAGATLSSEIQGMLIEATATLPIAKRMRWQRYRTEFVRPVRWLVALYGKDILDCQFHGRTAGAITYGHRAMSGGDPITLSHADQYEAKLEAGFVIADFEKRQALINVQLNAAASARSAIAADDPGLLEEVTALTEWPHVLSGDFDPKFLAVPEEALISAMREHQRYFHLRDAAGELQPSFLTVANLDSLQPEQVIAGNERVIRPRLADAQFFYNKDLQKPLEDALGQLNQVVFQNELGSFGDKARRISALAGIIAKSLGTNEAEAARAGLLAKTDLVSLMVGEFPELQGIMGSYYAKAQGESSVIADSILGHYLPRFSGDELPSSMTACAVAIADRIDTLVGLFGIGQPPTGSKDPFALRRQSLAVVRICIEAPIDLDLMALLRASARLHTAECETAPVMAYILDRFENLLTERGAKWDSIRAIRARPSGIHNLWTALQDIKSLDRFRETDASALVITAQKRVQSIIDKAEPSATGTINPAHFNVPVEAQLINCITSIEAVRTESIDIRLANVADSAETIDSYFKEVMVMDENLAIRENRLNTLSHLNQVLTDIAAFNLLQ